MKTKLFNKKLVLNKKTIAHLGYVEMKAVEGGADPCVTIGADTCISFLGWTCKTCWCATTSPCVTHEASCWPC